MQPQVSRSPYISRRLASTHVSARLGSVVVALLIAGTSFADVDRKAPRSAGDDSESAELERAAVVIWDDFRALVSSREDALVSTEVAARMLKLTAGVTAPGVPLPDLSAVSLPALDRIPVKNALLTSRYGHRRDPINGRGKLHNGLDFSAKTGTSVRAAGDGVVIRANRAGGYGRVVYIDHGAGFVTRYAHLNSIKVKEGERVTSGSRIGTVGSSGRVTGPHLHFEVRVLGESVDPAPFLGIKARGFGHRLRDLLMLPARTFEKKQRDAKTRG